MSSDRLDYRRMDKLDALGVPRPDGTPIGNLRHTLAVHADHVPDDRMVLPATSGIYGHVTGLTLGDLRAVLALIDGH
jgi:hypothetical protein